MKTFNYGETFTLNGVKYIFVQESRRGGGDTHFFAQEFGAKNIKMKQIAYVDLIGRI